MKTFDELLMTPINADVSGYGFRGIILKDLRQIHADADLLPAVKAYLCERIDAQAEALRAAVVTPGTGQAMEYAEAQAQAFAALAAPDRATPDQYQMLAVTIGVDIDPNTGAPAVDVLGVARAIKASYDAWQSLGASIRGARLKAKRAIKAAGSIEAACSAFDVASWPS